MDLKKIFIINLVLGVLGCLAHVPLIVLMLAGVSGLDLASLWMVPLLIPLDLILLLGAIAGLAGSEERQSKILPVHAVVLILLAAFIVGMLLWFIVLGFPEGRISWTPGLGAGLVGYAVHVVRRAFYTGSKTLMAHVEWYGAGVVFLLELLLIYKLYVVHFA